MSHYIPQRFEAQFKAVQLPLVFSGILSLPHPARTQCFALFEATVLDSSTDTGFLAAQLLLQTTTSVTLCLIMRSSISAKKLAVLNELLALAQPCYP